MIMATESIPEAVKTDDSPACALEQIGLQAGKSGDYRFARQVLQSAMKRIEEADDEHKDSRWIEVVINIADTYLSEGNSHLASAWYIKALERSEHLHGKNTLQVASLLIRLSELAVLESNSDQYQKYFDLFTRAYLLTQ